jgi:hypothetical protein
VHHIFARKQLAALLENPDEANSPANYALLGQFGDQRVARIVQPDSPSG